MNTKKKRQKRTNKSTRIGKLTGRLMNPALKRRGFTHSRIITEWSQIAGDAANWSDPENITFPRGKSNDGTLTVNICSGRGPEMQMLIPQIIERCSAVFGYKAVSKVTITQTKPIPNKEPPTQDAIINTPNHNKPEQVITVPENIGLSENLRTVLNNLGHSISVKKNLKK